jgi:hypothetical protein
MLVCYSFDSIGSRQRGGSQGGYDLLWQSLVEQLGEGRNVGITGRKKSVCLLKVFQGALRGGPHFAIRKAGIVTGAFQFALKAPDEVGGWSQGVQRMRPRCCSMCREKATCLRR